MTIRTHDLPPKTLGFWVKMIRKAANLSQDALAEAAGLTVRTVQRIEAGERASLQTRRSLARGLGYDDPNTFDDPNFIMTVASFMETMRADAIRAEKDRYPDHVKIEVTATLSGSDLAGLIGSADATIFQCDDSASSEAQAEAAVLFDNLRDWGDIWASLSFGERLEAQQSFDAALAMLAAHGVRGYHAMRVGRLSSATPGGPAPISFSVAYLAIVPADRELTYLLVPKQSRSE